MLIFEFAMHDTSQRISEHSRFAWQVKVCPLQGPKTLARSVWKKRLANVSGIPFDQSNQLAQQLQLVKCPNSDFTPKMQLKCLHWNLWKTLIPQLKNSFKRCDTRRRSVPCSSLSKVPPVCRSGYLLVVFGEVSEKSAGAQYLLQLLSCGKSKKGLRKLLIFWWV